MDGLKVLYPPPTPSPGGVEDNVQAARRLHRAPNARPGHYNDAECATQASSAVGLQGSAIAD